MGGVGIITGGVITGGIITGGAITGGIITGGAITGGIITGGVGTIMGGPATIPAGIGIGMAKGTGGIINGTVVPRP